MRAIATFNAGSSNIKLGLFDAESLSPLAKTQVHALEEAIAWLAAQKVEIRAIGHRVVHGGRAFVVPMLLDEKVIGALDAFIPLAPLHQPASLAAIRVLRERYAEIPHIACFDTAFHHTTPALERALPLSAEYAAKGMERYGFHGLSYAYIAAQLPEIMGKKAQGRIIVAHLGNGASMCAMRDLKSVATTMGFSTLDGLMMGTRSGALDAGAVLHLLEQEKLNIQEVTDLLYKHSGLKGVSGISADLRELEKSESPQAQKAIALFAYLAAKQLGGLIMALGGMDALVFTAGIGEHSALMRNEICNYIRWLGVEVDVQENACHARRISTEKSAIAVYVIPTNEEQVIAQACQSAILPYT